MESSMSDLLAMAAKGSRTVEQLKTLPIAFVLDEAGHVVVSKDGGGYATICPFHDDSDPSLDIYGEHLERWGCYPCGRGGDVLDLVKDLHDLDGFGATTAKANELLDALAESEWTGPTVGRTRTLDMDMVRQRINLGAVAQTNARDIFLDSKAGNLGLEPITSDWLFNTFGIGEEGTSIIIPYWNRNQELVTLKHRNPQTKALSAPGSDFSEVLYAEWRDQDPSRTVVLCEGETDVWAATHALWNEEGYVVLGLPTGAGAYPKQASRLANRNVILVFDGDEAGHNATQRWSKALGEVGSIVQVVAIPDGYDVAGLGPSYFVSLLKNNARVAPAMPSGFFADGTGYYTATEKERRQVSNWTFEPERELSSETGMAYEGLLSPQGIRTTISSADLASKARTISWSAKHGGAWYGGDRESQILLGILQARGPFLSTGQMTNVAGLHDEHFIWPGGVIGPNYWRFIPPASDVHLEQKLRIEPGWWDINQIGWLRALHDERVMDPILSWLALAPVRSLMREFPILAVTGSSGSGKTTLLEAVVPALSGSSIAVNLTNTTRHSLFAFGGATNAFPTWFDEYRPGARKDALETLDQILRDAYTGQKSSKGGMGDHWAEVVSVPMHTPMIVSGEDAFHETSHVERMVQVHLPLEGKNPEALTQVRSWGHTGLPHAFLSWLQRNLETGTLRSLAPIYNSAVYGELRPRQQTNMAVLTLGWELLNDFIMEHGGEHLGAPNFDLPVAEAIEGMDHNPIKDALLWAMDEMHSSDFISIREGMVNVRVENFVEYVNRYSQFTLPGGPQAVKRYLQQHYGAAGGRASLNGKQVRVLTFPAAALDS